MSVSENDATLIGLDWETWQRATQTRGFSATSDINYDAAAMPSQKAVCYGYYPSIELESMLLIKCKECGLILKDVGYGHHMRSQHGYHADSGSGDECQSFLLSPPHRVVSPRLTETPILSPPYRRTSVSIVSSRESSGRNGSVMPRTISPRYSVEQKDDLKLSLRVSRREAPNEANTSDNTVIPNGTMEKVQTNTAKVVRRLNGKVKDKKKKRKRDSSEEDNFSLEHFRQKKRLARKEHTDEDVRADASSNVSVAKRDTGVSVWIAGATVCSENDDASSSVNSVLSEAPKQRASVSNSSVSDKKMLQSAIPKTNNIEWLQENEVETFEEKTQVNSVATYSEQWSGLDLAADGAALSQEVASCPTLKSEKDEAQGTWASNSAAFSLEDSSIESQLYEDSEINRFYVPSPPQLSPVAEKECYTESMTARIIPSETDVFNERIQENILLQPRERLVPNGYREMIDLSRPSLDSTEDLYDAGPRDCVILEDDEVDAAVNDGAVDNHHRIEERIVATGPRLYGFSREEVPDDARNRRLLRNEDGYTVSEFEHRMHPVVQQKVYVPYQQPCGPQIISDAFLPQKRNIRTCSSPPLGEVCAGTVSYRDVYIDQEQKIYYPNARLLTVPINGKTTVDYPPQTRSSPPDIFSTEQNQSIHDLPDDVERSPQLPSVHNCAAEGSRGDMLEPLQLTMVSQEPQQRFQQFDYSLPTERSRLSLERSSTVRIASEAASEHPFGCSPVIPVSFYDARNSNYLPHMTRKKDYPSRLIRAVRCHADTTQQQPAASRITPHEVCVPIHSRSAPRPEVRYVCIPSKSSRSADLDHIYNRQNKDHEVESNEFGSAELQHVENQTRAEPTIRQVAIQKVPPTILDRIRPSTAAVGNCSVNVPTHRRISHHRPSSGAETSSFPLVSSAPEVMRITSKDRTYDSSGLYSYTTAGGMQRRTNAGRSKQRTSYSVAYQVPQRTASRQIRRAQMSPPADDLESRFGTDYVGLHLLNNGMVRDCSSFAVSVENRSNITPAITVQTTQLRSASFAGIRTGGGRTVTVVPVPVLAKCSSSTHYSDSYQAATFGTVPSSSANASIIPLSPFASESRTF